MNIIPAIDIINGKCVRLTKGNYSTVKIYDCTPLDVAKQFENSGLKHLHLVDLDGARAEQIVNHRILESIASKTNLIIDFGGGLKSKSDIEIALNSGASQVVGGTMAVQNIDLFNDVVQTYGNKVILGADCKNKKIVSQGWKQESSYDIIDFIQINERIGVSNVICTDVNCDGTLLGPSYKLYTEIMQKTKVKLVASGGVSTLQDLIKLKKIGCDGAIVGKAIYEGRISLSQLQLVC